MKCAILGGGGFMGSHLGQALLALGHELTVFDRPEARFLDELRRTGARIFVGDFLKVDDIRRALSDTEVVYHLVSTSVPLTSNDNLVWDAETNIVGTLRMLEEAQRTHVRKIIFASSGGTVYGIPRAIPITEDHPTNPTSAYGISKLSIEKYLHLHWILQKLDYCILRISNAYGEREPTAGVQGVIGTFLNRALHGQEIVIWGDGSAVRDYVYVGDVARAFVSAATASGAPRIFNVGSGQGHDLNDILALVQQNLQRPLRRKYMPARAFDVPANVLDISRAREYLDWTPKIGLAEGISRTYQWMVRHETEA